MPVRTKWFPDFEKTLPSLGGKKIAITGATSGTGRVAALTCLKKGAEVFILNRESKRAQDALQELRQAVPEGKLTYIPCDLQDFATVREAGRQLSEACQGCLDVLANNAGIMMVPDEPTKDGFEMQMQTNHFSHFLLTALMLPALRAAAEKNGEARVVNHSSMARVTPYFTKLGAKYLAKTTGKVGGTDEERYHQSKLANVLFTYELADRLAQTNIKAIVCTPGLAVTNLLGHHGLMSCAIQCGECCVYQAAEDGTMPLLAGIAGPDAQSEDLIVPSRCIEFVGPPVARKRKTGFKVCDDEASRKLLWTESEKAVAQEFKI